MVVATRISLRLRSQLAIFVYFFSKKKLFLERNNQRTLLRFADSPANKGQKVFCFFFSKKKRFLLLQ